MNMPDDTRLGSAYRRLTLDESRSTAAPDIDPETLQQLAAGTYLGGDREALIERALAHESTAREFAFFLDLRNASTPGQAGVPWRRWALAASLVIAVASGIRWFGEGLADDPLRASTSGITVVFPDEGATLDSATVFAWRQVSDASRYLVEVVREDGTAVATVTTFDTTATLTLATPLPTGERLSWWVTATLADGTTRRSAPALLRAR
jgi:hypothetical protein